MAETYTVIDGKPVLMLEEAAEGGYTVTSPVDPGLVTEAELLPEAFDHARDVLQHLRKSRARLTRRLRSSR